MTSLTQRILRALPLVAAVMVVAAPLRAQNGRSGGNSALFTTADFAKLHWLEGKWAGTAADEKPLFEQIRFVDDSTADLTFYRDASFTQSTANGRLYMTAGRVYHTFGSGMWSASHIGPDGVMLVPRTAANNKFSWSYVSPNEWTATMRSGVGGHERVVVYQMKRAQ